MFDYGFRSGVSGRQRSPCAVIRAPGVSADWLEQVQGRSERSQEKSAPRCYSRSGAIYLIIQPIFFIEIYRPMTQMRARIINNNLRRAPSQIPPAPVNKLPRQRSPIFSQFFASGFEHNRSAASINVRTSMGRLIYGSSETIRMPGDGESAVCSLIKAAERGWLQFRLFVQSHPNGKQRKPRIAPPPFRTLLRFSLERISALLADRKHRVRRAALRCMSSSQEDKFADFSRARFI